MRIDFAERARALVGTRFRPQGRDPRLGMDCVGLVLATFDLPGDRYRCDYRLRGHHEGELLQALSGPFRGIPASRTRTGDVLVLRVAADQPHLAVLTDQGFVHADARLGKVVETPGAPAWPIIAAYRRRARGGA